MQPKKPNLRLYFIVASLLFTANVLLGQQTFRDNFTSASYSNNDGTMNFSGNWVEYNEGTSATNGRIEIVGGRLEFRNLDDVEIERFLNLSGAISVTLSFDYDRTNGNESLRVRLSNGGGYNTIANLSNSGTFTHTLAANEISANSSIRFDSGSGNWSNSETIYVDNVVFTATFNPFISINDVTIAEDGGSAIFTATHQGTNVGGPFTVNYSTTDGTAIAGTDYTTTSGILNFSGVIGDSETIVVPITDDSLYDGTKSFTVQFSATSDPAVDITDIATGTITDDEIILNDQPLTLFQQFNGYFNYAVTGGSFRTQSNNTNACTITNTSSATGLTSTVPATATIERAYLIWAHSNPTPDSQVTFQGQNVDAELVSSYLYTSNRNFYGMVADVTSIIQTIPDVNASTYTVTGLTIDNSATYCNSATVLGGWSLMVFYEELSLPAVTINFYNGFDGGANATSSFTLNGFYAIGSSGSKTTSLSWEGDATLANNENLQFITASSGNTILSGDGGQNGTNPFNSTIYDNTVNPVINNPNIYGVDLDTYDVSNFLQQGESTATTRVQVGQDLVIMNSVLLKVPSNLITGTVFEDVNYGGGMGRNQTASSGVPISGAVVELYDATGGMFASQTTDSNGQYTFGGMVNGTYSLRVVNNTVSSTRLGGTTCSTCMPVQTYRANYIASNLVPVTTEVGGSNPAGTDSNAGVLANAQSVSLIEINSEGAVGVDFGFNFNTIVNTNEDGQGSLEQFIVNSNALDASSVDIEANSIFDPAIGDDTSVFMISSTTDPLGRAADVNFANGYFDITISNVNSLSQITGVNTKIDGRTQTAYSGDTNAGTVGASGNSVGTSAVILPDYERPEIQIHSNNGDVIRAQGTGILIRNLSIYAGNNSGVRIDGGTVIVSNNFLGVNALGVNSGNIDSGVEMTNGTVIIDGNYIATNTDRGIEINGGTSTLIQNNHLFSNGDSACDDNISLLNGSGIIIQQNLIDQAASFGIELELTSGNVLISENTITNSGRDGGNCGPRPENAGIGLRGNNSTISNNIVSTNGGAGITLLGANSSGNLMSQNSIYANGVGSPALGIDIGGDGITLNDTNDADNGQNEAINFPIISASYYNGTNLVIEGWARPGSIIEIFLTDISEGSATAGDNQIGMTRDYGEGQVYLATVVEGSVNDTDANVSSYNDVDGNTDNTNKYKFSIPISGIGLGDVITTTATISNTTSEFSPLSILKAFNVITNRRITYRVKGN